MADRSAEYWYPTEAYLYVLHMDGRDGARRWCVLGDRAAT